MSDQNTKPSRWYYILAVLVFVVGCVLFGWFLFRNLNGLIDNLTRVIVPGKAEITLSDPGTYTIFYEYQSVLDNKLYSSREDLSGLECTIKSKTSGSKIPISRSSKDLEYSFGGRKGIAVLEFTIEKQGAYEFAGWYSEGQPRIVLAIGRGFMDKFVGTIVLGMAIFLVSSLIGVAIALRIFFKRQEALKKG